MALLSMETGLVRLLWLKRVLLLEDAFGIFCRDGLGIPRLTAGH